MKTRRFLHQTDLARVALLRPDEKRRQLEGIKLGVFTFSYDPLRQSVAEILNIEAGPLAGVARAPWSAVEDQISRKSRSENERRANVGVGKALYEFATARNLRGRRHEIFPLNVGVSEKIAYWSQAVIGLDERPVVPFIDPRRQRKWLTHSARQFVFSVMHERFNADPDLDGVSPCIVQFDTESDGTRTPVLHFSDSVELLDFDTLDAMIQETYAIWQEVLEERDATQQRRTGTGGSLL